jgi:GNAT superfamily N-acetyltransferase
MLIRQATKTDARALAELSGELGYPSSETQAAERLALVSQQADNAVFVAEAQDRRVMGWIHIFGAYRLEVDPFAEIGGLVVADSARSSGVGLLLLEAAESWAIRSGFRQMRVRSNVIRDRAHNFYRRNGYLELKKQAVFEKKLTD